MVYDDINLIGNEDFQEIILLVHYLASSLLESERAATRELAAEVYSRTMKLNDKVVSWETRKK